MSLRGRDLAVGDIHEQVLTRDLTRTQLVMYAGVSGDFNPMHTDEVYAREVAGYPGVFAHGMLTMGMTARALTDWVGDGRLVRYGVRFRSQVWPGDALTARLTVTAVRESDGQDLVDLEVVTVNGDGIEVISGYATARVDQDHDG
ncbi:MaoC family dehydratase N-terminal domain-containing protein [Frankia sp. AgPm24]|uniref:MaoC family dehydratase N-terminal domain-containing protein n=1 Tax=Frankia umida TaxID=573489 RepID=A0ABT0K3L7_9ACTN|nr:MULTISPECIES: MaoC/PaaZ C-terminal domain-containing protein [Frankia]MCK9877878.1 MaoC family dehydratase N-terminal domain-containing protein [Frankia umida]MCK9923945.1 MaoC family dehydratase N-terminal domain-containing protein [Frankia sp. AgPm24]